MKPPAINGQCTGCNQVFCECGDSGPVKKRDIKTMVAGNKKVQFVKYLDQNLWYTTEDNFEFPVPISDVGNATFLAEDRAMLFMRYIRKHLAVIEAGSTEEK